MNKSMIVMICSAPAYLGNVNKNLPGVQGSQSASPSLPVLLLKVPGGHNSGVPVPIGQ